MTDERGKRKVWSKAETLMFLSCYRSRKDEFDHPRKKKTAYAHVLEDMVYQGFEDTSVKPASLEGKMRTLLMAYKFAKDNASRTWASPCPVPYVEEMDELFGNKAIISHSHSLDVGLHKRVVPLEDPKVVDGNEIAESSLLSPQQQIPSTSPPIAAGTKTTSPICNEKKTRKTAKERYYDAKLEMKKAKESMYREYLETKIKLRRERDQIVTKAIEKMLNK